MPCIFATLDMFVAFLLINMFAIVFTRVKFHDKSRLKVEAPFLRVVDIQKSSGVSVVAGGEM